MKKKYLVLQIKYEKATINKKLEEELYKELTDMFFYEDIFMYTNKEYVYVGTDNVFINYSWKKANGLINLETDAEHLIH